MIEQIRSFIAIELPEPVKIGLRQIQDVLKSPGPTSAKWVDPNSIHLTLKFLGNVSIDKIAGIITMTERAIETFGPFRLEIGGLGAFPNMRRVQVVWVGIAGDLDRLQLLQKRVESKMAELGFPPEGRAFTPHLTLARVRDNATPDQRQALGQIIAGIKLESSLIVDVNSVSLMRSQLNPSGAVYTELHSFALH